MGRGELDGGGMGGTSPRLKDINIVLQLEIHVLARLTTPGQFSVIQGVPEKVSLRF